MYDMNELLPVVAMLTKKYTGIESSSVSYEKANQLMEAVLYCIRETETGGESLMAACKQNAMQAYKTGAQLVRRKTEELLSFYECHKRSSVRMETFIWRHSGTKECRSFFSIMTSSLNHRMRF